MLAFGLCNIKLSVDNEVFDVKSSPLCSSDPLLSDTKNVIIGHTDLTITTEKLMELFAPLDPEKVDELGSVFKLGLPQSEIDRIQKDYQSPTQRKEAYLDLYVHQHPCPDWSKVARVLRSHEVNLRQQADLVENTYVKGTPDTL